MLGYECAMEIFKKAHEEKNASECPQCRGRVTKWVYSREYSQLVQSISTIEASKPDQEELSYSPKSEQQETNRHKTNVTFIDNQVNSATFIDNQVNIGDQEIINEVVSGMSSLFGNVDSLVINNPGTSTRTITINNVLHSSNARNLGDINTPGGNTMLKNEEQAGSIVTGNLTMMGNSECNGVVTANKVTLMGNADCNQTVHANNVTLMGNAECNGSINANVVTLMGNAECNGVIDADTLIVKSSDCKYKQVSSRTKVVKDYNSNSSSRTSTITTHFYY